MDISAVEVVLLQLQIVVEIQEQEGEAAEQDKKVLAWDLVLTEVLVSPVAKVVQIRP